MKNTKKSKDLFFCLHFKRVYVIGDCRNCDKFEHVYKLFGKCKHYVNHYDNEQEK